VRRLLPRAVIPLRVSPGLWWLDRGDSIGNQLFQGIFEVADRALLAQLLRPGMTVLDIGANAGIYALTAAAHVGPSGHVIAFEPSAREREQLTRHLALNRLANVRIEATALGASDGDTEFYVADAAESGFNSRKPAAGLSVAAARVPMCRLDTYAARTALGRVDFVKIDVEGGEYDVLVGGEQLFRRTRPPILIEIEPARIEPWGYRAEDIYSLIAGWQYDWAAVTHDGLVPLASPPPSFAGNYLARPR
jgi:FkbM family methyltransferase